MNTSIKSINEYNFDVNWNACDSIISGNEPSSEMLTS